MANGALIINELLFPLVTQHLSIQYMLLINKISNLQMFFYLGHLILKNIYLALIVIQIIANVNMLE